MADTGLNTLGFIKANSLTYTEIKNDEDAFIEALSEDARTGFKTQFEGTTGQILKEIIAAKSSDEIYHIITSRNENLLHYCNRVDSATAISQNNGYSVHRGSNIKLRITVTPKTTAILPKLSVIGSAEDYDIITADAVEMSEGKSVTFDAYLGSLNEQSITADSADLLIFRFTNKNISEQIALFLNGSEVPYSTNLLDMLDDKYFCISNAYGGVDAIYLNNKDTFTHRYSAGSVLKLKYIEFQNITLSSIDAECYYGDITNVTQLTSTQMPEDLSTIKTNAQLYAETQNRIVARDDFQKVFQNSNPEILDAKGQDFSPAQVEVVYVKKNGELLTNEEYQKAYNNLYRRRSYGIPMCLLSHPDIMLNLDLLVLLQLNTTYSATMDQYVRRALAKQELKLGTTIDFSEMENELESYEFVKTARVLLQAQAFQTDALAPEGRVFKPTTSNGKYYVVRNPLFLSGSQEPSWSTSIGDTTIDNDLIWTTEEISYAAQPNWAPNTSYRKLNIVRSTGLTAVQFRCTGYTYKTGSQEPVWPTEEGKFVNDGQIMWISVSKNVTADTWKATTITEKGTLINPTAKSDVSFQAINYIPKTPSTEPEWKTNLSIYTDGPIQYAMVNAKYDPENATASNIKLNWNQYVRFNETIQVVV